MSADEIKGYIRDAGPEEFPNWVRHEGYRLVIVDALVNNPSSWQKAAVGLRCRFMEGRKSCGKPAKVQLLRTAHYRSGKREIPWGYCGNPDHLYGRVWVDGRLESARLVEESR